jgi:hypothetical protein
VDLAVVVADIWVDLRWGRERAGGVEIFFFT